ncbi:FmdE family protein [Candidatus Formimonas warabiya]|uniref:Formylmethanofuran dehydrogenase n=1 Tax=Formimonas warabiya TaxID=1761012 RepID=A0A3G1KV36_FORW1|nr:FmdE family protein [Candidatus Formimonas warabiya]ATW26304.1 formylmethanofuran dehydrogenase [Candidatus Formimonas warabiya]
MDFDRELWKEVVAFHGHECPGLAIGFRAVRIALDKLGVTRAKDEELLAIVETDACSVDAVQVVAGCSMGKGNLIYKNHGKQAFTIVNRKTGQAVRVYVDASKLAVDKDDRMARMTMILTAPEEEFCKSEFVDIELPEKARIFPSVVCECCGEKMAEIRARIQKGKIVCLACFEDYSR